MRREMQWTRSSTKRMTKLHTARAVRRALSCRQLAHAAHAARPLPV
jgi:hypothetical protein